MIQRILSLILIGALQAWAEAPAVEPVDPGAGDAVPDDGVRVSVLGYHDFSTTEPETEMRIHTAKFRKQLELIERLGISVISLTDFIAWKKGEKAIPEKSILLTFDDGWKSVYEEAFPVLREFNHPFTLFLYKNYVDGGGRALTRQMIREMIDAGATIGSHSVSHPYPIVVKKARDRGADEYDRFLRKEIGESKRFLESTFRSDITTYSYPGGFVTAEMLPIAEEFGYQLGFTVNPGKVKRSTPDMTLPRFMILGNYDRIFEFATNFHDGPQRPAGAIAGMIQIPDHPVTPTPGAVIISRVPEISVDLSGVENLDPASPVMRVAGFAKVPARYNPQTGAFSWQVNRRLRQPTCQVEVTWKDLDGNPPEKPLRWSFQIDREAAYLLEDE